jgi:hypothetical protein
MSTKYALTDMTGEMVASSSHTASCGWHFVVLMSRQGKIRLSEFFSSYSESEKRRILRDIAADVLPRAPKMCNIIEKGTFKFVYRRYASLYFVVGVPQGTNELIALEQIHLFVEALDGYFNSGRYLYLVAEDLVHLIVAAMSHPIHNKIKQFANWIWSFPCTNRCSFCLKCSLAGCCVNPTSARSSNPLWKLKNWWRK